MTDYNFKSFKYNEGKENNRMLVVIACSMLFLTIWGSIFSPNKEELEKMKQDSKQIELEKAKDTISNVELKNKQQQNVREKKEVFLENENVIFGIDVNNNKISYLKLKNYKKHEIDEQNVILLDNDHFIDSGFISNISKDEVKWNLKSKNGNKIAVYGEKNGFVFESIYTIKDNFLIENEQKITNNSGSDTKIKFYTRISLKDTKDRIENSYAFRGIVSNCNEDIKEINYDKMNKIQNFEQSCIKNNWIALSDQYWLTAIISNEDIEQKQGMHYNNNNEKYQVDISNRTETISNKNTITKKNFLYVGPKSIDNINKLQQDYNIDRFDKTIDFGIFYFIAKPLLTILKKLYHLSGNFGISIILLTILVRMIIFPLANRSYKEATKMQSISGELKIIREKYKNDNKAMQTAMYSLYKDKGINPTSAIWPMLLQIPILFALYKVLIISIEMRDTSFLWIKDLSTKDPTSFLNLFGLLPFEAPSFLHIGILPCIMGITMFIQQKITPQANMDKTQQKMMLLMPLIFLVMFSGMPAGLILYWSCSNIFTIIQQTIIVKVYSSDNNNNYSYKRKIRNN